MKNISWEKFIIVFTVICWALLLLFFLSFFQEGGISFYSAKWLIIFFVAFLFVLPILFIKKRKEALARESIMNSFAKKNNFIFKRRVNSWKSDCQIFSFKSFSSIKNYIEVSFEKYLIKIYNYEKFIASAPAGYFYIFTIYESKIKKTLPKTIITSFLKNKFGSGLGWCFREIYGEPKRYKKLEVDNNEFDVNFSVLASKKINGKERLSLLKILDSNVIDSLNQEIRKQLEKKKDSIYPHKHNNLHIELCGNTIVMCKAEVTWDRVENESELQRLLELFISIIKKIDEDY